MRTGRKTRFDGDSRLYLVKTEPGCEHSTAYCQKTEDINGVSHACTFRMRTDKLKANLKKGNLHICRFKPLEDIRRMFQLSGGQRRKEKNTALVKALAGAVGQLNVSLEAMLSPAIHTLMEVSFELGQTTQEPFDSVFSMPQRRALRACMLEESKAIDNAKLEFYRESRFVSLSIDEGTTFKQAYLNFILHDVVNRKNEYFAKSVIMSGKTADNYVVSIHLGFVYFERRNLNISSIVMDGSKAQAKAFAVTYPRSLRKIRFTTETAKKVITFPCACHLLENAYKKMVGMDRKTGDLIAECRAIGRMLNELPHSLATCPRFVSTRWVYDYDIVKYLLQHRDDARDAVHRPVPLESSLRILKNFLGILRTLIARFESASSSVTEVYPIIDATINSLLFWKDLRDGDDLDEDWTQTFSTMAQCLQSYFLQQQHTGLLVLSYILTPNGRKAFTGQTSQTRIILPKEFRVHEERVDDEPDQQELDEVFMEMEPGLSVRQSKKEKILLEQVNAVTVPEGEVEVDDNGQDGGQTSEALTQAYDALRFVANLVGVNEKNALTAFDAYLDPNNYLLREHLRESIDGRWFNWNYMQTIGGFAELSEIAQRIMPTPASEASAERSISLQRAIILAKRNKAYRDLVRSREILMQASKENTTAPGQKALWDMITTMDTTPSAPPDERDIVRRRDIQMGEEEDV